MEEELTQSEIDQMRKFATLQKVALCILRKWLWLFIVIFSAAAVVFSVFLVRHTAKSGHRFVTTTQLLYNPRQVAHIQNMSDKQLMSIIDRKSIKRRVGDVMLMERSEKECLTIDLEVKQEKHPSNLFTLTATGPTLAQAARKVNSYAELIIGEYVSYRTRDLDNWRGSLNVRRETLQKQISEVESEENTLKAQSGVVAPIETLTMVNGLLSDQRRNLSMLTVQITNEETKQHKFEAKVGKVGRAVSENAGVIRKKSEEISALNKEIALLRERYTDKNPKVIGKLDELKALLESYTGFLKEKGIDGVDLNSIDQLEKVASDLAETMLRLDALHESRRSLESEIASNEKRAETLTGIIPAFDRLRVRRADLEQAMRDLDEQVDNISYLQMSVRSDLRQIERAAGADDKNPFRIKNFAIAFAAAVVGTIGLSMMILILEFAAGKVVDGRELSAYDSVKYIGSLPKPGAMREEEEKDVLGVVALKFANVDAPKGVILICRLPGVKPQTAFRESLHWSLAMAGEQSFTLEVVLNSTFTPPQDATPMLATVVKGTQGWFPVENRFVMAPTELQMLQADLAELRRQYDHVFVHMPDGMRRGGSFFDQLLTVCDSAMMVAAIGKTPRSAFTYVRSHVEAVNKPLIAIAAGVGARVARREMESRQ